MSKNAFRDLLDEAYVCAEGIETAGTLESVGNRVAEMKSILRRARGTSPEHPVDLDALATQYLALPVTVVEAYVRTPAEWVRGFVEWLYEPCQPHRLPAWAPAKRIGA